MKRTLLIILFSLAFILPSFAENGISEDTKEKPEVSICPKTKMDGSCMTCHVYPDMSLKEKKPDANRIFPYEVTMNITDEGKTAVILITTIASNQVAKFFEYVVWHPEITKCIFEIMSPGGSLFDASRIVGFMEVWKKKGMIIETRVHGMAFSAGFVIFINGSKGYRFASEISQLMWHELITFAMFKISRPADIEEEAVILRHIQDTFCEYLSKRTKLTKKQWKEKVYKKEFWCNAEQAIKFGLSDGYPK